MDVSQLHDCFLGSLQADPEIRKHAEIKLKEYSSSTGFLGACLDILSSDNVQPIIKQSCSIYFKNMIVKSWTIGSVIDNDERPIIRERLLVTMTKLDKTLRNQLLPALNQIIKCDYPDHWSNLLENILQLINNSNNDINSLYIGIFCFAELCRNFRWKHNDQRHQTLDPIITNFFPSLLSIGQQLVSDEKLLHSYEASEILKLIIKCYKFVTYLDFPLPLQQNQALVDWITFHVQIINTNYSQDTIAGWIKSQKWAYHNLYRLFQRYGTKSLSSKLQYDDFRNNFRENVLPQLINVYIENLKKWSANEKYIADSSMYYLISLIEQCLLKKATFQLIEPHFNFLIVEVSFKIFNPKDEDLELFEDEPEEYIHKIFEIIDDDTAEDALHSFLFTLAEKRTDYLVPMFQYVLSKFGEMNSKPETLEVAKAKESLMKFLSPVSYKLSSDSNPIANEIEPFLNNFIIPNFNSNFQFLRARTCNLVSKFDTLDIKEDVTTENLFKGIISCFSNNENGLPVQIEAALAIQSFINLEDFKKLLENLILPTMEKLMELSNKFDSDILPAVMQELVESFPEKLEPFAEQLMEQLCLKLMSLLKSIGGMYNANIDDFDDESAANDKTSTALGILNTMITILLYFENSTEIIGKLEVHYSKVIKLIFNDKIEDFYAEAGELIENTLFLTRSVSPIMWSLFGDFILCLLDDEDITLYLEDALPSLKNYLIYGGQTIKENVEIQESFFKLILCVFQMEFDESDNFGTNDLIYVGDLSTTFILALDFNTSAKYIPTLINYSLKFMVEVTERLKTKSTKYIIQLLDVIIASLVIDPNTTLKTLIEGNQLELFLSNWFNYTQHLKRVFDLKLSILGYISLLSIDLSSLNSMMLTNILSNCGINITKLFIEIPKAIKDLEKKRTEYTEKSWANEQTFTINALGDDDNDNDDDDEHVGGDGELDYEHLFADGAKFDFMANDEELDEDPYSNTNLDKINIFQEFQNFVVKTQSSEADKYGLIFGGLSEEDKHALTKILSTI